MITISSARSALALSSRRMAAGPSVRPLSTTFARRNLLQDIENRINPREVIEKKRKEYEEKYGDKLIKKAKQCVYVPHYPLRSNTSYS